jgi:acetyltransferase-like isoleucine patch superfamily enzyme
MEDLYDPEPTFLDNLRIRAGNARRLAYGAYRARRSGASFGGHAEMAGRICFRVRGTATFGRDAFIEAHLGAFHVHVGRGCTLTAGDGFRSNGHAGATTIQVRDGGQLIMGDRVGIAYGVTIECWHEIRIGDRVRLAPGVYVIDDNRHELEPGAVMYKGPVIIGENAWLGRGVTVLPGVSIGARSVVTAHSVVTQDIPADVLAGGAPAKVIRKLELPDDWYR